MGAARGDTKPCTYPDCPGTMQFSREPLLGAAAGMTAEGQPGWVCSATAAHFQLPSALPPAGGNGAGRQ